MSRTVMTAVILGMVAFGAWPALAGQQTVPPGVEWVKTLALGESLDVSCAAATGDGGFVLAAGPSLVKFSAAGEEVWRKPHSAGDGPKFLASAGDSGFLVVNSTHVGRYDAEGDLVAERSYGGRFPHLLNCLETDDGRFLLCGSLDGDAWLLEADQDLSPVWQKTYDAGADESALAAARGPDGSYVVACKSGQYSKFGTGPSEIWVLKCDAEGRKLADYRTAGIIRSMGTRYLARSDGHYYVCHARAPGFNTDTWVVKLDGELNELWQKSYGTTVFSAATPNIASAGGGRILVAGTQPLRPAEADAEPVMDLLSRSPWVALVDAAGAVVWEAHVPLPPELAGYRPRDIVPTKDGCVLIGVSMVAGDEEEVRASGPDRSLLLIKLRSPLAE